jgi:uncharacterized protein DUF222
MSARSANLFEQMFESTVVDPDPSGLPAEAPSAVSLWVTDESCAVDVDATLGRLVEAQPGVEVLSVAVALSGMRLTDRQRVDLMAVMERCDSWLQAIKQPILAGLGRSAGSKTKTPGRYEDIGLELSLKLCWSEWMAHDRMLTGRLLDERLPRTWRALAAGDISFAQARVIATGAALLDHPEALDPVDAARQLEERVFPEVTFQSRTATEKAVAKAVIGIDPKAAEERRRQARKGRGVYRTGRPRGVQDRLEGRSGVYAEGADEDMATIWQALSIGGDQLLATGQVDTLSQGRHDTFLSWAVDFLNRQDVPTRAGRPAAITVIAKDSTLRGEDDDAAELVGYGPITAESAREIAAGMPPAPGPFSRPDCPVDEATAAEFGRTQGDEIDDPDRIDMLLDDEEPDAHPFVDEHPDDDGPPHDGPPDDGPPDGGVPAHRPRPRGSAPPGVRHHRDTSVQVRTVRIDPENGFAQPPPGLRLDYGTSRRVYPGAVIEHLKDKYRVCAFPGCTAPVHQLDGDHWQPVADGGPTDASWNGGPCCPHHNRITRNREGWSIIPAGDGTATLITPHGRSYPITPHDYRD